MLDLIVLLATVVVRVAALSMVATLLTFMIVVLSVVIMKMAAM